MANEKILTQEELIVEEIRKTNRDKLADKYHQLYAYTDKVEDRIQTQVNICIRRCEVDTANSLLNILEDLQDAKGSI